MEEVRARPAAVNDPAERTKSKDRAREHPTPPRYYWAPAASATGCCRYRGCRS